MKYCTACSFYLLILILGAINCPYLLAQDQHAIDSLTSKLKDYDSRKAAKPLHQEDTIKVKILIALVRGHLESNPQKALQYAKQQLKLSEAIHYKDGIANACVSIGVLYDIRSEYATAFRYHKRALDINLEVNNLMGVEDCYYNIGSLFGKQSNYPQALAYTLKGLAIAKKLDDDFGMAGGYNNLGVLYKSTGNLPEALKAYFKSIDVMRKMQNFSAIATTYNNIGTIYMLQHKAGEALNYHQLGLSWAKKSGNKQAESDNYHSIGEVTLGKKQYGRALNNYQKALKIQREIEDAYGMAESQISIGQVNFKMGNHQEAARTVSSGLLLAERSGEQDLMLKAYRTLSEIYATSKDYKLAYKNHVRFKEVTDSLFNAEKNQKFVQLQMQYDIKSERDSIKTVQAQKDLLAQAAVNDQKTLRNFIVIVMGLVVVFLIILIWQRNKIAKVRRQKALEAERNRISRDLHDNLGAQLSTVRMFVSSMKSKDSGDVSESVENAVGLLDSSINDLRGIMDEMNSSVLLEAGYLAATEVLINRLNQLHVIDFSLTHHKMDVRPDSRIEHQLYRITQELVNNTLKYARAKHITIDLIQRDGILVFMYEDDGIGFDITSIQKGYGLQNIETRIRSVGGNFMLDSMPNAGARAIIEIPLS